ncbi:unnamed protein product [Absidia cylindrospora]
MEQLVKQFNIQDALEKNSIDDAGSLLEMLPSDASRLLRITPIQLNQLYHAAAAELYPIEKRQLSIMELEKNQYLTCHDPHIDDILGKGIPLGSITEVVGESSSGKTQLCLQLCFTVQKPKQLGGLGGECVYLYNEGKFSTSRCLQLATWFGKEYDRTPHALTQSIHTMYVPTTEEFYRTIAYQVPVLLARNKKIRLVVIDSIGSAYRGCGGGGGGTEQQSSRQAQFDSLQEISDLGVRLKKLAYKHKVAIVVVNQVSDAIVNEKIPNINDGRRQEHGASSSMDDWLDITLEGDHTTTMGMFIQSLAKKPILGLTWSTSVTTRIRMARSLLLDGQHTKRAFLLEFSPWQPRRGCEFVIHEGGIQSRLGLEWNRLE